MFDRMHEILGRDYNYHALDKPGLETHRDLFREACRTIQDLNNNLNAARGRRSESRPYDILKSEIAKCGLEYLENSHSPYLATFSKKVEHLQLVFKALDKAFITVEDPHGPAYISFMLTGIETSLLHKSSSCCSLLSIFSCVGAEDKLCNDVSKLVGNFNKALNFNGIGSQNHQELKSLEQRVVAYSSK